LLVLSSTRFLSVRSSRSRAHRDPFPQPNSWDFLPMYLTSMSSSPSAPLPPLRPLSPIHRRWPRWPAESSIGICCSPTDGIVLARVFARRPVAHGDLRSDAPSAQLQDPDPEPRSVHGEAPLVLHCGRRGRMPRRGRVMVQGTGEDGDAEKFDPEEDQWASATVRDGSAVARYEAAAGGKLHQHAPAPCFPRVASEGRRSSRWCPSVSGGREATSTCAPRVGVARVGGCREEDFARRGGYSVWRRGGK
jgi:hypothetical protein